MSPPTTVVVGGSLAALVLLVLEARRLYFFGDDWSFLLHRSLSWPDLLEPHNEHWSTLPIIAFRVMFHLFGLDHYLPYALMPIVLHLACTSLSYALLRRNEVPAWPAALVAVPFALMVGRTAENPLWDFQIGLIGSALGGLLALHCSVRTGRAWTAAAAVVLLATLPTSGLAIPAAVWVGAFVLMRDGLRRALVVTVPAAVGYLAWFSQYGRGSSFPAPTGDQFVAFMSNASTYALQESLRLPASGTLALLGLVGLLTSSRLTRSQRSLAVSGVVAFVTATALTGLSRASLGPDAAAAGRYNYFILLSLLPASALALAWVGERCTPTSRRLGAAVLVLALSANGAVQTVAFADERAAGTRGLRHQLVATERMVGAGEAFLQDRISPQLNPDIDISSLRRQWVRDAIPDEAVRPRVALEASLHSQVASSGTSFGLPYPAELDSTGLNGMPAPGGCAWVVADPGASIDLRATRTGSQLTVTSAATGYAVQLVGRTGRLSRSTVLAAETAGPTFIGSTSPRGTLRIQVPAGPLEVCLTGNS